MWKKDGKWYQKATGDDFGAAQELMTKLQQTTRTNVSIRSMNVGFPPPARITEYEEIDYVVRLVKGVKKKVKVVTVINLLEQYNDEGHYWCSYCIKVRKFQRTLLGQREAMVCPACGITTRDGNIRRYNPKATNIDARTRRPNGRRVRRRT
jgi:hypothetical protein